MSLFGSHLICDCKNTGIILRVCLSPSNPAVKHTGFVCVRLYSQETVFIFLVTIFQVEEMSYLLSMKVSAK